MDRHDCEAIRRQIDRLEVVGAAVGKLQFPGICEGEATQEGGDHARVRLFVPKSFVFPFDSILVFVGSVTVVVLSFCDILRDCAGHHLSCFRLLRICRRLLRQVLLGYKSLFEPNRFWSPATDFDEIRSLRRQNIVMTEI